MATFKTVAVHARKGNQGTGQIDATAESVNVEVAVNGANSVITLPQGEGGSAIYVTNNSGSDILIYPALGDKIAAESANTAITMLASTGRCILFLALNDGWWAMSDVQWR